MLWKITADELMSWANSRVSQGELPELIRRLIHSTIPSSKILRIVFPAGNSIGLPGWDGVLETSVGNAWVPKGESRWELSCQKNSAMKIVADYQKRTGETSADQQQKLTFVFATPRRVRGKPKWTKEHPNEWDKIRILDAVNLEEWLEIAPSVSRWLAEKMGKNIDGFRSLDSEWDRWAGATDPKISAGLVLADRENASESLRKFLDSKPERTFAIAADSKEEAAAFVCAEIEKSPELRGRLIVVRKRVDNLSQFTIGDSPAPIFLFVDKNDAKDIGNAFLQSHVIIADSQGGSADESACRLNRISREKFIAQLKAMGLSREVANRRERESGRSLTVLRRRLAKNSALKTPEWAQGENSRAMIVAALAGGWCENTRQTADQKIVADMQGGQYDDFEREVIRFMGMDDAPIERIGGFLQVKSRLDALLAVAKDITQGDLKRFFCAAKNVFLAEYEVSAYTGMSPRPAHSDCLRRGLAESLILLSVYAKSFPAIGNVGGQVDDFIRDILADKQNWILVAGFMPQFAEASPKVFLDAVESALEQDDPIIQTMFERGFYTHLLWAFEKLAWEKNGVFEHIVFALARMSSFRENDDSAHSPQKTLLAFFRSWLPQCAAPLNERNRVLRQLADKYPSCAKKLADSMLRLHNGAICTFSPPMYVSRPHWKHSPSDFEIKLTVADVRSACRSAIEIAISLAECKIGDIVSLIEHIDAMPSCSDAEKICARVKFLAAEAQVRESLIIDKCRQFVDKRISRSRRKDIFACISHTLDDYGADNPDLFRLEARLFKSLNRYDSEYRFPAIYRRLATDPQFFVDLISCLYTRDDGKADDGNEASKIQPELAHRILNPSPGRSWTFAPGLGENGAVSEQEFLSWSKAALRLSEECGRLSIAEEHIGKMLFGYPADKEGVPSDAVGKFLEEQRNEKMEKGYYSAIDISHGVYWADGGKPEKKFAEKYAVIAGKLRERGFSQIARVYEDIAAGYGEQAEQEKTRSDLRDRGH